MLNIRTNIDKFVKVEIKKYVASINAATISTSNKLAKQGLVEAKRRIRNEYSVKLSDLNKDSRGHEIMYTENTRSVNTSAKIVAVGRGISLGKFKARQKKTGVEVQVHVGRKKLIKHAFGPRMQRLGKGVWARFDPNIIGAYFERSGRLPIYRFYGPSPARMLQYRSINKNTIDYIRSRYPVVYEQEFKYRMSK